MKDSFVLLLGSVALVAALACGQALATTTFVGDDADGRSAQADFTFDGLGGLTVVLTNEAGSLAPVQSFVLTGIVFTFTGDAPSPALTPVSASVAAGSNVFLNGVAVGGDIEWGYGHTATNEQLAGAGWGAAGHDNFPPVTGANLNGIGFGIAPELGVDLGHAQFASTKFIEDAAQFSLTGVPLGVDIDSVTFIYGTSLTEAPVPGNNTGNPPVPEPVTMLSAFLAISSLGMYIRKRSKTSA
jgi:hypothetical protein